MSLYLRVSSQSLQQSMAINGATCTGNAHNYVSFVQHLPSLVPKTEQRNCSPCRASVSIYFQQSLQHKFSTECSTAIVPSTDLKQNSSTRRPASGPDLARTRLREVRDRLGLRFRDVEEASQVIAERHGNDEFAVPISRLSAFENDGSLPSIYKLYSLCAIYRLEMSDVLGWYGVDLAQIGTDAYSVPASKTHLIGFDVPQMAEAMLPLSIDIGFDSRKTGFLSRHVQRWGVLPLTLLQNMDVKDYRYAVVGEDDLWMFPYIQPGALLVIDEGKRRMERGPWSDMQQRPVYFVSTHDGDFATWVSVEGDQITLIPHPQCERPPRTYLLERVEVIGQVVGMATRLDQVRRGR
jgi:transcriptional regulator with XRE-family HTH domain